MCPVPTTDHVVAVMGTRVVRGTRTAGTHGLAMGGDVCLVDINVLLYYTRGKGRGQLEDSLIIRLLYCYFIAESVSATETAGLYDCVRMECKISITLCCQGTFQLD